MKSIPLDLDGYTDLPDDKIALVVTFLEVLQRPGNSLSRPRTDVALEPWSDPDINAYRDLFREVGQDWLWFGRLSLSDEDLAGVLRQPGREHFRPIVEGRPVGLLEIDYTDPENPELAYFGLVPGAVGTGLGRWLMAQAVDMVWARPETRRFWVHTCTGDSPQAIGFYQSCGFLPYKRAIEIADDPRLAGLLPKGTGPHVPCLGSCGD
jgi:GNAT superfamily N-acetyltransferase